MVNTKGLDKAKVLASLYNASKPQGLGILHFMPEDMTNEEAAELLKVATDFDYVRGRIMKVNLSSSYGFEEYLYDRDNGQGAAERAIMHLRK